MQKRSGLSNNTTRTARRPVAGITQGRNKHHPGAQDRAPPSDNATHKVTTGVCTTDGDQTATCDTTNMDEEPNTTTK